MRDFFVIAVNYNTNGDYSRTVPLAKKLADWVF